MDTNGDKVEKRYFERERKKKKDNMEAGEREREITEEASQ